MIRFPGLARGARLDRGILSHSIPPVALEEEIAPLVDVVGVMGRGLSPDRGLLAQKRSCVRQLCTSGDSRRAGSRPQFSTAESRAGYHSLSFGAWARKPSAAHGP